jgi:uncharacterized protein
MTNGRGDEVMRSAILVMLIASAAPALAQETARPPQGPPVIVTTGEGIVKQAPDRAWVTIAAESRSRTPQEAQRQNTEAMAAVIDKLKASGIAADAIQTTSYDLQPEFDYVNGKQTLRDYVARNRVQVRVDALPKLGDLIASAVGTGATNVSGIRFDLKDREGAEREALRRAVRDARMRADAAASGAGVQIDRVVRIAEEREGFVRPPIPMASPMAMRAEAAAPAVPIEAGEIEIHARVTLAAAIR